ncbi:MAG: D-alanyl-D-alanine carboxypeptidase, partial [Mycobacterium sp.]
MRKLLTALAFTVITLCSANVVAPPAAAQPGIEPSGAVALPEGPAQAWLLADLDTGAILAS